MKILVIGGTRFFGKRLVHQLIKEGHEITIFSRGQTPDDFGHHVTRWHGDRTQKESLQAAVGSTRFDVVIDQMCMTAHDADVSNEVFKGKTDFYIMTSTLSVYPLGADLKEEQVDPTAYREQPAETAAQKYAEGKRAAENAFATRAPFPWAMMRIPVVLGEDDYTERLWGQVRRIQNRQPIYYPNLQARISFVHAEDAAKALLWLAKTRKTGIFNIATPDTITPEKLISLIENEVQQKALWAETPSDEAWSPFGLKDDWYMNVEKAKLAGFQAQPLSAWLVPLVEYFGKKQKL